MAGEIITRATLVCSSALFKTGQSVFKPLRYVLYLNRLHEHILMPLRTFNALV